jgi:hypothetical protein
MQHSALTQDPAKTKEFNNLLTAYDALHIVGRSDEVITAKLVELAYSMTYDDFTTYWSSGTHSRLINGVCKIFGDNPKLGPIYSLLNSAARSNRSDIFDHFISYVRLDYYEEVTFMWGSDMETTESVISMVQKMDANYSATFMKSSKVKHSAELNELKKVIAELTKEKAAAEAKCESLEAKPSDDTAIMRENAALKAELSALKAELSALKFSMGTIKKIIYNINGV